MSENVWYLTYQESFVLQYKVSQELSSTHLDEGENSGTLHCYSEIKVQAINKPSNLLFMYAKTKA